jgi:hypothetical protein
MKMAAVDVSTKRPKQIDMACKFAIQCGSRDQATWKYTTTSKNNPTDLVT